MALFGNKGRDKELAKVSDFVRKRQAAGETQFVVPVYLMANGAGMLSIRRMQEDAVEHLSELGYSVVDIRVEDWEYTAYLRVAAIGQEPAPGPVPRHSPAPASPVGVAGSPQGMGEGAFDDPEALDQWYRSALTTWKNPTVSGVTFAPGFGFEDALNVIRQPNVSEPIFQAVASSVADGVVNLIRDGVSFDEYDRVLGMTAPQLRSAGLRRDREMTALLPKLQVSKDALIGLATMKPDYLQVWTSSHVVRQECFAYHATFLGRMGRY